jgi:hypothetical protein
MAMSDDPDAHKRSCPLAEFGPTIVWLPLLFRSREMAGRFSSWRRGFVLLSLVTLRFGALK